MGGSLPGACHGKIKWSRWKLSNMRLGFFQRTDWFANDRRSLAEHPGCFHSPKSGLFNLILLLISHFLTLTPPVFPHVGSTSSYFKYATLYILMYYKQNTESLVGRVTPVRAVVPSVGPIDLFGSPSIAVHLVPSPLGGERVRVRGGRLSFFEVHGEGEQNLAALGAIF
jgi:hypothetical protein